MINEALSYDSYEIIGGEKFPAPSASAYHNDVMGGLYGVPDMVAEVLSRSTRRKDLTIKKDIYEANGVKEYWIIDPRARAVDVYILRDGKFELDESYFKYTAEEFNELDEEEKVAYKPEIKVSIFYDLFVKVDDISSWVY